MVFAHITVREHVVAELLRVAQARAMAEHDPGMRAQDGDVVGDGLGVGRADADVDHADAAAVGAHQVVGRHLRQARRHLAHFIAVNGGAADATRHDVARLDKGDVLAGRIRHRLVPKAHELVDVELVIGEQQEILEVLGRGAGVVAQAVQRVVDARRREQGKRLRLTRARRVGAVGDAVVHRGQIGQIEHVAHQLAPLRAQAALDVVVLGKREVHGDRLRTGAHFQFGAVVLQQQGELLQVVAGVQVRACQRRLEATRPGDKAIAQMRTLLRAQARDGVGLHAHERVTGARMTGQAFARNKALHGRAQVRDAVVVDLAGARQSGSRIGEARRGNEGGQVGHDAIVSWSGTTRTTQRVLRPVSPPA